MRHAFSTPAIALLTLVFSICGPSVSAQTQTPPQTRSPGGDVGRGAGDLVTLHPIDAAGNVGKGAAVTGKDVGVSAAKGTGKIAKGTGRGIGKIFHHGRHDDTPPPPPIHRTKTGGG